MVSSYVPEVISEMAKCLEDGKEFMLIQLFNRDNKYELDYTPPYGVDGINVSANHVTKEMVLKTHKLGKTVGVWLSRAQCMETQKLYDHVYDLEVDFVYVDAPVPAMTFRDRTYLKSSKK